VTYYDEKDKSETTVLVPLGQNLLEAAHENNVDLEGKIRIAMAAHQLGLQNTRCNVDSPFQGGSAHACHLLSMLHLETLLDAGACECSLACSTCHVVVEVRGHQATFMHVRTLLAMKVKRTSFCALSTSARLCRTRSFMTSCLSPTMTKTTCSTWHMA
jgi:ferredoxin